MLKFTSFVTVLLLITSLNLSADVLIDYDTTNNKKELSMLTIPNKVYLVQVAPFDAIDISRRVNVLSTETKFNQELSDNKTVKYYNKENRTSFIYDKTANRCTYNNRSVEPLVDGMLSDVHKYRSKAEKYLKEIIGDKSINYKYINHSYDECVRRDNPEVKSIAYISYLFTRIIDDVPVLGVTSQIRVTIGKDGKLLKFQSNEPLIEEYSTITTEVKKSAIKKIITKKVSGDNYLPKTQDGIALKVKKFTAKKWTGSYFEVAKGGKRLLYPHVSIFAENDLESNQYNLKTLKTNLNLSMNGSDWSDLDADDIESSVKKK